MVHYYHISGNRSNIFSFCSLSQRNFHSFPLSHCSSVTVQAGGKCLQWSLDQLQCIWTRALGPEGPCLAPSAPSPMPLFSYCGQHWGWCCRRAFSCKGFKKNASLPANLRAGSRRRSTTQCNSHNLTQLSATCPHDVKQKTWLVH